MGSWQIGDFCVFHERKEGNKIEKGRRWRNKNLYYILLFFFFFLVTSHWTYIFSCHWEDEIINMIISLILWAKKLNWNKWSMCESDPMLEGLLNFVIVYSHKTWLKHLTIFFVLFQVNNFFGVLKPTICTIDLLVIFLQQTILYENDLGLSKC